MFALAAAAFVLCTVHDGDSLRCGEERVRLLGIDAPELGQCPQRRICAPGDGQASKRALQRLVEGHRITLQRFGHDRYGRTLAIAWAGPVNLSCRQVQTAQAIYRRDWDRRGLVGRCASLPQAL